MALIVRSILSSTMGLLLNRVRISTAAMGADITDANISEIIITQLNDIKTKTEGFNSVNLLGSYDFLQEGINLLNVSLNKLKLEQNYALVNETQDDRGESVSTMPSAVQSGIFNEALELSHAMRKLNNISDKEFESAKKRFGEARKTATLAFRTESLSVQHRILAAKVRIVSEILEYLENPETAITGCLPFLKKLHSIPAIQNIFTVYLNGGVKSKWNKAERVESVKSVMFINHVLFQHVSKFGSMKYSIVLAWPTIDLADRSFHPILHWQEISTRESMGDELTQHPNRLLSDEGFDLYLSSAAVNSHSDIFVRKYPDNIKVISINGESKVVKSPDPRERHVINQRIVGLAVDKNNNVYTVEVLGTCTENIDVKRFVLYVLDENYNVRHDWTLDFLDARNTFDWVKIAITSNDNIIMIRENDPNVYVCDNTGKLRHKFQRDSDWLPSLSISGQNEIMISSGDFKAVHIYTEEGSLRSTIELPEGHMIRGGAFHYAICKIIVLTYVDEKDSYFLLCYTVESGELERSTFLYEDCESEYRPQITSHPGGPVAVVRQLNITFI